MFKIIRSGVLLILLSALVLLFDHKQDIVSKSFLGNIPPLGRFFDPYHGIWRNADPADSDSHSVLNISGISKPVSIIYDLQRIPHIFASNESDLYFTQGYITAKDRLWQMEFQTYAAAGRISEIIGEKALAYDRYQRRLGMVYGAQKSLESMLKDPVSKRIILSYTAGINAWIDQLDPSEYALEYKLLDYKPEHWTPLKCMLLLKSMAATLSAESDAPAMSANLAKFGKNVITDLFPDYPFKESPVIPEETKWDFKPLKIPSALDSTQALIQSASRGSLSIGKSSVSSSSPVAAVSKQQSTMGKNPVSLSQNKTTQLSGQAAEDLAEDAAAIGSNNWALSGSKTANGKTLLANDPHLKLNLPSIWYAVQLNAPGINVEGVSLPGAPGVVIGFNEHISWGVTNVGAGVFDIYQMHWKDKTHTSYAYNGGWKNTRRQLETINIRGKESYIDTVTYTHQGPVVQDKSFTYNDGIVPKDMAVRWAAHEGFNEVKAFYLINKASEYKQFVDALVSFGSPGQNFAYADDQKNIALWVNGKFPLKYAEEGKFILDGSLPVNDWKEWIPHDQVPHILNPVRGFVSSANQSSTNPSYPYYLNWKFGTALRGLRINSLLSNMLKATPDSLKKMQSDVYNTYASEVLPLLLSQISSHSMDATHLKALGIIKKWNLNNDALASAPAIFDRWANYLDQDIWDEFDSAGLMKPNRDRTLKLLLTEPNSYWFDVKSTKIKETRADIINSSFRRAIDSLSHQLGNNPSHWKWFEVKQTAVMHILKIDAFSRLKIKNGGGSGIINALTHSTGPSWRMVVQPGIKPIAFGVYPGGQSGNPGSFWYDNMLDSWAQGKSYSLIFWHNPAENISTTFNTINLNPKSQ